MTCPNLKIGITHGDVNGIGYEIIIKTLMDNSFPENWTPIIYGSNKLLAYHKKALNIQNFAPQTIKSSEEAVLGKPNLINAVDENTRVEFGKMTASAGNAAYQSLEKAVEDLLEKKIDILVTAPINKFNIQSEKFSFPGHTEYLAQKFNTEEALMLMVGEHLKIAVVTGHVPIAKVSEQITIDLILKKLRLLNQSLIQDFVIRKPSIAILGLNPHAGDNGIIGREEIEVIIPALEKAREEGILALGPYAADGFFAYNDLSKFDAILAMYHDQGLVPFKSLIQIRNEGVNYTAGLPIIRTSPAHGTGYDIVGKGEASADSMKEAIFLACKIYQNRLFYSELTQNILPHYDVDQEIKNEETNS